MVNKKYLLLAQNLVWNFKKRKLNRFKNLNLLDIAILSKDGKVICLKTGEISIETYELKASFRNRCEFNFSTKQDGFTNKEERFRKTDDM